MTVTGHRSLSRTLANLSRIILVVLCLVLLAANQLMSAVGSADPLPYTEKGQLINSTNWVASSACSSDTGSASPTTTGSASPGPVYIMGDSITALAKDAYESKFQGAGWSPTIEGLVSRQISTTPPSPDGLQQIDQDKSVIGKANAIVIALGTNGVTNSADTTKKQVQDAMSKLKSYDTQNAPIFWVNVMDSKNEAASQTTNQAIKDAVGSDGKVIDWYSVAKSGADYKNFNEGVHPTSQKDINLLVDLVYNTVNDSGGSTVNDSGSTTTNAAASNSVTFDDSNSSPHPGQTDIDTDGSSPSYQPHQADTNLHADGVPLDTDKVNWYVLQTGWADAHNGIKLGDVAALTYHGKTTYALFGDNNGTGSQTHSEISVAAAKALGGSGPNSLNGVHTVIYPGSHKLLNVTPDSTTYANTNTSMDQLQTNIDKVGQQVSGGTTGTTPTTPTGSGSSQCCPPGSGTDGTTTVTITGNNVKDAFLFFTQNGFSAAQSAGIVGNLMQESGVDPTSSGSGGCGIAGFTSGDISCANMHAWVSAHGEDPNSLQGQLDFLLNYITKEEPSITAAMKKATDPSSAAVDWENAFEGCKGSRGTGDPNAPGSCLQNKRIANAQAVYQKYGDSAGGGGTTGTTGDSCPGTTGTTTSADGFTNPFPGGWVPNRLDMGYDGTFKGQIVAPFDGTVTYEGVWTGWEGSLAVQIKADKDIGLQTRTLYFTEGVAPIEGLQGKHVTAGTPIANPTDSPYGDSYGQGANGAIEWGVDQDGPPGVQLDTQAIALGAGPKCAPTPQSRAMVLGFSQWFQQKLHVAPPSETNCAGAP